MPPMRYDEQRCSAVVAGPRPLRRERKDGTPYTAWFSPRCGAKATVVTPDGPRCLSCLSAERGPRPKAAPAAPRKMSMADRAVARGWA